MMIYMSDTAARPWPRYCAGDCIFIGSGAKVRPQFHGDPDHFRQVMEISYHQFACCNS